MLRCMIPIILNCAVAIFLLSVPRPSVAQAPDAAQRPEEKPANKQAEKPPTVEATENPAQIELLETRIRFEADGSSRKEVHARVKINNEIGARQFARLNFDYNRAFEQIEIPLVQITHASGGIAEILPSAITDNPNPAVVNAPAYQDLRVKTVRILGLEPGDSLEYRVITTVSHHPLAPDFWLDHSFDRTGVISKEIFELDLPTTSKIQLKINQQTPATSLFGDIGGIVFATRKGYHWERTHPAPSTVSDKELPASEPDISLTTFASWNALTRKLVLHFLPRAVPGDDLYAKVTELTRDAKSPEEKLQALYDFASQKIRTVDLSLGAVGFSARQLTDVIASGYANQEEKAFLLIALCAQAEIWAHPVLAGASDSARELFPSPGHFSRVLVGVGKPLPVHWLDPSLEVAPLGAVQANLRGKRGFLLIPGPETLAEPEDLWPRIEATLPFASRQQVLVDATLAADGNLSAKVHYSMRGDNELLLRVAFHRTQKEKWKDVAQLLALSDGFRGQITNVTASDPYATKEPFTVDYEISQPKFVDWSKKPVRIPAILPLVGLPDPPAKTGATASPIDLGTPLDVEAHFTLHLPPGTTATAPTGTSVQRDYATFSSSYSAQAATISASRHLHFLLREIPAARAADYNAFIRAVQNDETQEFTLERAETLSPKTNSAAPTRAAPPKPNPAKP